MQDLVAQTIARFGQIDVLVNNAALYAKLTPRNFNEWDAATWDKVMAVNTRGPFLMVKHVAPHMMARRSGKIINIASGAAYKGVPRMLPYVSRKGAMLAFTRALSRELGDYGIAVNSLSPGYILSATPGWKTPPMSRRSACRCAIPALSSATLIRKICSARWYFSPPVTAISSPASRSWWTAVRSTIRRNLFRRTGDGYD